MDAIGTAFDKIIMNHRWSVNRFHLFGLQANRTVTVDVQLTIYTFYAAWIRLRTEKKKKKTVDLEGKKTRKERNGSFCM